MEMNYNKILTDEDLWKSSNTEAVIIHSSIIMMNWNYLSFQEFLKGL